ncbi:MAG: ABC transporter permease, partial [Prolixibacteraceae bacterium]|nr:ABC transporter permease [Prolixibacteraceae bacterium]
KASVSYEENRYIEERMFFAEPEFLEIFNFKFIKGNPERLNEPNIAFISESTARKYFGSINPVGLPISIDKKTDYRVAGIFEDVPHNSHIKFDILLSYKNLLNIYGKEVENSWGDTGWFTYLLLGPGVNPNVFESKLPPLVEKEFGEVLRHYNLTLNLVLQPLTDIHLTSNFMQEFEVNGNANTVKYLSLIAILAIIMAWVNYINLSTARSLSRAHEVGLRKASGANRSQLVIQFFLETILTNIAAIFLTLILIALLLIPFSAFTNIPADYRIYIQFWFWKLIIILFISGTVLSGIYPVFILISFNPADVLKNRFNKSIKGIETRKVLVVTQFIMAIGLMAFTISIYKQLSFMRKNELGFSMEQKLVVRLPRVRQAGFESKTEAFRNTILSNPSVNKMCVGTEVPGKQIYWDAGAIKRVGSDENKNYRILGVDYDYIDLFKLELAAGRNFSRDFPSDSSALILNEKAVEWMGFESTQSALGKQVDYWGNIYNVIGVVKNYHQESVKQHFLPQIFRFLPYGRDVRGNFTFEISDTNPQTVITDIRNDYNEFFPNNPFEYFFLDEYYNQQYKTDELFGKVIGLFSFLAIFITCLGIFGLATFIVIQRLKEIGVRKVNGANVTDILVLLNKDMVIWVLISIVIASPATYYFMIIWLESFALKTTLSWWIFVLAGVIALGIALLTVSWQSWRAATRNPVEALRYE